jgi:hypothetical protein
MERAVEFVGDGYEHLPGTTLYEITERGLEILGNKGYLHYPLRSDG